MEKQEEKENEGLVYSNPKCDCKRHVEPFVRDLVKCKNCGKLYQVITHSDIFDLRSFRRTDLREINIVHDAKDEE